MSENSVLKDYFPDYFQILQGMDPGASLCRAGLEESPVFLAKNSLSEENWCQILARQDGQRYSLLHGGDVEKCWGELTRQQQLLSRFSLESGNLVADLHLPHVLWGVKSGQVRRQTHALSRLHNALGWLQYCAWYDIENRQLIKNIAIDDAEKYQLIAACELYDTEVESEMLEQIREDIATLLKHEDELVTKGDPEDQRTLLSLEKQMIRLRLESEQVLKGHEEALKHLSAAMEKLIPNHPEYAVFALHLKILTLLLSDLTGKREQQLKWLQQLQFLQLLNREWRVVPICAATADDPGVYMFAALLSLSLVQSRYPIEILTEVVLDWEHYARRVIDFEQQHGGLKIENWLQGLVSQRGDHPLALKLWIVFQLRTLFSYIIARFASKGDLPSPTESIAAEISLWLPT